MVLKREDLVQNGVLRSFSFNPASLETKIKSDIQAYDKNIPSTWPVITLAFLNRHLGGEYTGRQDLPGYIAYDTAIVEKYLAKHLGQKLSHAGDTLHDRYPCNFTQLHLLKQQVGMTTFEQSVYRSITYDDKKQIAKLQDLLSKEEAEHKKAVTRTTKWKRSFQAAEVENEDARSRAMEAEHECQNLSRQRDVLQMCCEELSVEIERLKGGNKRARVEDYESDEETMAGMESPQRRARYG